MKKNVTAFALVLLLVFSMAGGAFADITYTAPVDVEAGLAFKHLLATVSSGNTISAMEGSLPPGCEIVTEETSNGLDVYLSGTPSVVGSYNCAIDLGNSNSLIYTLNVSASKPTVIVSPDVSCSVNEVIEIFVKASIAGSGQLGYQWYVNSTDSTTNGQPIIGATGPTYVTNTSVPGCNYYYCVVTNSSGSQTRSTVSDTIEVRVTELQPSGIYINTLPSKIEYMEGDSLDTAGLSIRVDYTDGSSTIVTDGFSAYPTVLEKYGLQEIQINYLNQVCTFNVKVDTEEELIEKIEIGTMPHKTKYELGEDLDIKGLTLKVTSNKGETSVKNGFSCVPSTLNIVGKQTVTVRYQGKSCTFEVTVNEPEVPIRIDVASRAKKLEYIVGDALDTTGLVIRVTGSNGGSEEVRSGFTCEPSVLSTSGKQKITVNYEGFQCTYYVTVTDKNPAATTAPTASPAPSASTTVSPNNTPSPAPSKDIEHKPYDTGISTSAIFIIMIIALVIMLALGGFVFVMQRGGFKNMFRRFKR